MASAARRSRADIAKMRVAGRVVAEMHARIRDAIRPGVTTRQLDLVGREVLEQRGASSNFLGYYGYPAVICASPNELVVHGIPDERVLVEGDLVSIDCGAIVDGWHGDAAITVGVGDIAPERQHLIDVAERALAAGIAQLDDSKRLGDVGHAVQRVVEEEGCAVVAEYTGHAIGRAMHEPPNVPNVGRPGTGMKLRTGNVFAVEPILTSGSPDTYTRDDGWTVVTVDGGWAAHVEHTIAVTDYGPQILTV